MDYAHRWDDEYKRFLYKLLLTVVTEWYRNRIAFRMQKRNV